MSATPNTDAQEFFGISNRLIELANEMSAEFPRARVSAAFLYSAARYNSFSWLKREANLEQTEEEAIEFFVAQYRQLLKNNLAAMKEELTK